MIRILIRSWLDRRRQEVDLVVLEAIHWHQPCGGADIWRATGLSSGRIYPSLHRLLAAGEIRDEWEVAPGDRPARRLYRVAEVPGGES